MPKGRPFALLAVPGEDGGQLEAWSRRPKTAQALAVRSRLVPTSRCGQGQLAGKDLFSGFLCSAASAAKLEEAGLLSFISNR